MTHTLIVLASAVLIVWYWIVCRRRSLVHRENAADLLVNYFEKKGVSESDKDSAEFFYRMATHWAFMPLTTLLSFPVLLARVLSKRPISLEADKEKDRITDEVMKMYLFRNPLTGAACFFVFFLMATIAMLLGLFANRLRAMPSPSAVYRTATVSVYHPPRRHAH